MRAVLVATLTLLFACTDPDRTLASDITLEFPLAGGNPYSAEIITVVDHSAQIRFYNSGAVVTAYTGETGRDRCGPSGAPCGYYNPSFTSHNDADTRTFVANDHYVGAREDCPSAAPECLERKKILNYSGHPGYDYKGTAGVTQIVAAAAGKVYLPKSDPINGKCGEQITSPWCGFHTFYIDHGGGWTTWYLHANSLATKLANEISSDYCNVPPTKDIYLGEVKSREMVGLVGTFSVCHTIGEHLHFEVRRTGRVVDPYGWEWSSPQSFVSPEEGDPIAINAQAGVQSTPLWTGFQRPTISNVTLSGTPGSWTATVTGDFLESNRVATLWHRDSRYLAYTFGGEFTPPSKLVVQLTGVSDPGNYVVKVGPVGPIAGPRSIGWRLVRSLICPGSDLGVARPSGQSAEASASCGSGPTSSALILIGQPADGGGAFSSFAGFDGMNNVGDVAFEAWVDLSGNCTPGNVHGCRLDDIRAFRRSAGEARLITVPGISRIGTVRINEGGDIAVGQLADPGSGFGSGTTVGILLIGRGGAQAREIARWGQATPLGGTYYQLSGPLAISEDGDVVFQSCILNSSGTFATCNYNWVYRVATGLVTKLVASGEPTSIGGTFATNLGFAVGFTDEGEVVFPAEIVGGTSGFGIFIASRNGSIRKVVAANDSAPSSIGGRLGPPRPIVGRPVAGRKLVFVADAITGGSATEAIISKDDVTVDNLTDLRVVARKGQATGTDVGGTFQSLSNGAGNPQVRRDGAVLFDAVLVGAVIDGQATDWGIFLWTGREMKRVAVSGEQLATGGRVNVGAGHILNDIGQVRYFATGIQ